MREMNLYALDPSVIGNFDIILFFGVLYHLRYPFWGLKRIVDCLADRGFLLIETGVLVADHLKDQEILYCPVERSPYGEPSSCTFFNETGLTVTLRSFNLRIEQSAIFHPKGRAPEANVPPRSTLAGWLRRGARAALRPFRKPPAPTMDTARQFFICRKDEGLQKTDRYVYSGGAAFEKDWATSYWNHTHTEHSRKNQ